MIEDYYDTIITIKRKTTADNGIGGKSETWNDHLTILGKIRPLNGNERFSADKVTLYATHRLYCTLADITELDRVVYNNQTYEIKYINNPMNMNRFLQVDLELVT